MRKYIYNKKVTELGVGVLTYFDVGENWLPIARLGWYVGGSGCLIKVLKKAKIVKIKEYGAWFWWLGARLGDGKEGVQLF